METFMLAFALSWGAFCFIVAAINEFSSKMVMDYAILITVFAVPLGLLWFTFFSNCGNNCKVDGE